MNLSLPRDFQSYSCFRRLEKLLDPQQALLAFVRLWVELGYQIDVHGGSGLFTATERDVFMEAIKPYANSKPDEIFSALVRSDVLRPSGGDWVCPMFTVNNRTLDHDYIPKTVKGNLTTAFRKISSTIEKQATPLVSRLPKHCWQSESGAEVTPDQMRRAVVLIKMVDQILRLRPREPEGFTPGLVQACLGVTSHYTDDKLTIILRRLHHKKSTGGLHRSTDYLLTHFDDLVCKIMPDEGYVKWAKETNESIN